jgi:hypothetical protein
MAKLGYSLITATEGRALRSEAIGQYSLVELHSFN